MSNRVAQCVTIGEVTNILEKMTVAETIDLGASIVHVGTHDDHGEIAIVTTIGERHLILNMNF